MNTPQVPTQARAQAPAFTLDRDTVEFLDDWYGIGSSPLPLPAVALTLPQKENPQ